MRATFGETVRTIATGISPVLAFLLIVLTPVGTGQGMHQDQLLDPVFPHLHFLGNVVTRGSPQSTAPRSVEARVPGLALGAAAGASEATLSVGLTPVVPAEFDLMPYAGTVWRMSSEIAAPPGATADPPPDPPPDPR